MSKKEDIEKKSWDLLLGVLSGTGLKPVDAEYVKEAGGYFLRFYIDSEDGVTIEDCEKVSSLLDPLLDEEDFIADAYTLEVSSPGLGRVLKRPHDFEFAEGKEIELKTYKAVNGKKEFRGTLKAWSGTDLTIESEEGEQTFSRKELSLVRLAFDF